MIPPNTNDQARVDVHGERIARPVLQGVERRQVLGPSHAELAGGDELAADDPDGVAEHGEHRA